MRGRLAALLQGAAFLATILVMLSIDSIVDIIIRWIGG